MASDATHSTRINGIEKAQIANGFHSAAAQTRAANNNDLNPENKKITFIVGTNVAAHKTLRDAVSALADQGIPCEIILTDALPKGPKLAEKLGRPEVRNFAFFDKIMIKKGYPIIESMPIILDSSGDLDSDLVYTPKQLAEFYTNKGVNVTVEHVHNINDPTFIDRIKNDDSIARAYNIRNMQIMSQDLIDAFENKTMQNGLKSQIINIHPADVFEYPGTNTAFWMRMNVSTQNVWTAHVIDKGIDSGPFLDKTFRALKSGKTLMQDLCSMAPFAAQMIVNDGMMFLGGSQRPTIPQNATAEFSKKPNQHYTYAKHDDYIAAFRRGIVDVAPQSFIPAIVEDHFGDITTPEAQTVHHILAEEALKWQNDYLKIYHKEYNELPPQYQPSNPGTYFISVPPLPVGPLNPLGQSSRKPPPAHYTP